MLKFVIQYDNQKTFNSLKKISNKKCAMTAKLIIRKRNKHKS